MKTRVQAAGWVMTVRSVAQILDIPLAEWKNEVTWGPESASVRAVADSIRKRQSVHQVVIRRHLHRAMTEVEKAHAQR